MAAGKETAVQRACIETLQALGALVFRMNSGQINGTDDHGHRMHLQLAPEGTPDILAILRDGRCVWVEVKYKKGQLREAQKYMIENLQERGHKVIVARSVDDLLEQLGFKPPFVIPHSAHWVQ